MEIHVELTSQPLRVPPEKPGLSGAGGAVVEFTGVVRSEENGERIEALEYEAYDQMATSEMRRLLEQLGTEHPCMAVRVVHRLGIVPVGEAAIWVRVISAHRQEAFQLIVGFMNRLKCDVPIWKVRAIKERVVDIRAAEPEEPPGALEVLEGIRSATAALTPERVDLASASGRFLREELRAREDDPPFDRSSVDGFAIRMDDLASEFCIVDEIRAGEWKPRTLAQGQAVRIATGGALPGQELKVLMKEDVQVNNGTLRVVRPDDDRNIRFRGENRRVGDLLAGPGRLTPGVLALLASAGCVAPLVSRLPRAVHLATGDEIVPPDQTPKPGQIRDSNSVLVSAFLKALGISPLQERVPEDASLAREKLRALAGESDLLLISGGASVGEHDFTRRLLEEFGYRVLISRTRLRPGKPHIFAVAEDGRLAFGLPGNPLAHFICLNLFVRAAIEALAGEPAREVFHRGEMSKDFDAGSNRRETLWPACVSFEGGRQVLRPLRWNNSGDLTCLSRTNALLRVPARTGQIPAGAEVSYATTISL